jgi:hypothetical protein
VGIVVGFTLNGVLMIGISVGKKLGNIVGVEVGNVVGISVGIKLVEKLEVFCFFSSDEYLSY